MPRSTNGVPSLAKPLSTVILIDESKIRGHSDEKAIDEWVHHYNHERYQESLDNVTPADVFGGSRNEILDQRALVKARTMTKRKIHHLRLAG